MRNETGRKPRRPKRTPVERERYSPPALSRLVICLSLAVLLGVGGSVAYGFWVFNGLQQTKVVPDKTEKGSLKPAIAAAKAERVTAPAAKTLPQPEQTKVDLAAWAEKLTAAGDTTKAETRASAQTGETASTSQPSVSDLLSKVRHAEEGSRKKSSGTDKDNDEVAAERTERTPRKPNSLLTLIEKTDAKADDAKVADKAQPKAGPPPPPPPIQMPEVTRKPDAQAASRLRSKIVQAMRTQDLQAVTTNTTALAATNCSAAVDALLQLAFVPSPAIFDAVRNGLSELTHPEALDKLLKRFRSASGPKGWMLQVLILDSFSKRESPPGFEAFNLAIKSNHPKVRLAAARSLARGKWSDVQAVPLLVAALEQAEKYTDTGTLHWEIRSALVEKTGYDFSTAKDWVAFMNTKGTPDADSKGQMTQVALEEELEYYGNKVTSRRLLFIIDTSGSMNVINLFGYDDVPKNLGTWIGPASKKRGGVDRGPPEHNWRPSSEWIQWVRDHPECTRMERAKSELARLISAMPKESYFNIIAFSTGVRSWKPTLVPATPQHVQHALKYVKGLHPSGNTESDKALEEAFDKNWMADTVYFLSDGEPSRDGMEPLPIDPILDRVSELNRFAQIIIHSLQVAHMGQGFMKSLAGDNKGSYQNISNRPAKPFWK